MSFNRGDMKKLNARSAMFIRFGSIVFAALVTGLFLADARAEDECPEFCDRTNAFSVAVPSGWTSIPERWQVDPTGPTPNVTLHMISPSAPKTGANCPVLTTLAASIGDWARMRADMDGVELNIGFWQGVVRRAGFTLVAIKKMKAEEAKGTSKRLIPSSYVELRFKTPRSGEETLTAREGLFWLPLNELRPGRTKPDDFKHIPGRVHFVNCTAKTDAFESVRAPFDGVFRSFRPKYCYAVKETSVPVCEQAESNETDKQRIATRSPLDEPAAAGGAQLSALGETFDEAMLNAAAQVLAAGEK